MHVKQTIRTALWGFSWGYVGAFLLCMGLLEIGFGCPWLGLDGLLDMARYVFISQAQYFFLIVGTLVAIFRARYTDMDDEAKSQEFLNQCEETTESWWKDRPE
jgi:hypothetical protein